MGFCCFNLYVSSGVNNRLCLASSLPWSIAGRMMYITLHKMVGPLFTKNTRVLVRVQDSSLVHNHPLYLHICMVWYCNEISTPGTH